MKPNLTTAIQAVLIAFAAGLVLALAVPAVIKAIKTQQDRAALAASQDDWATVTLYGTQTYRLKVRQSNRVCLEGTLSLPDDQRGRVAGSHTLIVSSEGGPAGSKASTLINLRDIQAATLPDTARTGLPLRACPGVISGLALRN